MTDSEGTPLADQTIVLMESRTSFVVPRKGVVLSEEDYVFFAKKSGAELVKVQLPDKREEVFRLDASREGQERLLPVVPSPDPVPEVPLEVKVVSPEPSGPVKDTTLVEPAKPATANVSSTVTSREVTVDGRIPVRGHGRSPSHQLREGIHVIGGVQVTVYLDCPTPPNLSDDLRKIESRFGYFNSIRKSRLGNVPLKAVTPMPLADRVQLLQMGFSLLDSLASESKLFHPTVK
jgi:hypothetical protein